MINKSVYITCITFINFKVIRETRLSEKKNFFNIKCTLQVLTGVCVAIYIQIFFILLLLFITGPPTFLLENLKVQYGSYGNLVEVWIQIYSNVELLSSTIRKSDGQKNITSYIDVTRVIGHVVFHGVKVMVLGSKLLFNIRIHNMDDFNNYTVKVCNIKWCINMTLELRAISKYFHILIYTNNKL